ncbi:MAG: hypothetical protein Q8O22_07590, partial [Candidatus Omnitrophota bacterium]|nr:hypothetical protein [Candidatus Omnitrophota bacterium]
QYVAHSDAVKDNPPPKYEELFAAYKVIEEVVKKYNILLRSSNGGLTPEILGNWEEVLTIPWLEKNSETSYAFRSNREGTPNKEKIEH